MLDTEINFTVKNKLEIIGYTNLDSIRPQTHKHLIEIEKAVQFFMRNQEKLISDYKDNSISITNIVSVIDITRQTIYNNEILEKYISLSKEEQRKSDVLFMLKKMNLKIQELEKITNNFHRKSLELEKLRLELRATKESLSDLQISYESLRNDNIIKSSKKRNSLKTSKSKVNQIFRE